MVRTSHPETVRGYRVADNIEVFPGGAALLLDGNVLVVADLHLGYEAALEDEGLSIPRVQTSKIGQYLMEVIDEVRPSRLIVAGDMKHNFSRNLTQEWQDVDRFVRMLSGRVKLEVIKGNHDNYLGAILGGYGVPLSMETDCAGVRILHGHRGALKHGMTIMGHIHPSIRLRDSVGATLKNPCFLFDPKLKVLVLPALSLVSPGTDIIGQVWADGVSPLLPETGLSTFEPIAFSGTKPLIFPTVAKLRMLRQDD
ncbi:MAG: metallophosphoesterase [Candidatus Thermoplasmatota archaeon]|nr:metallophosphoesterase [Candidatus Thermoplasmatota archaeon]